MRITRNWSGPPSPAAVCLVRRASSSGSTNTVPLPVSSPTIGGGGIYRKVGCVAGVGAGYVATAVGGGAAASWRGGVGVNVGVGMVCSALAGGGPAAGCRRGVGVSVGVGMDCRVSVCGGPAVEFRGVAGSPVIVGATGWVEAGVGATSQQATANTTGRMTDRETAASALFNSSRTLSIGSLAANLGGNFG